LNSARLAMVLWAGHTSSSVAISRDGLTLATPTSETSGLENRLIRTDTPFEATGLHYFEIKVQSRPKPKTGSCHFLGLADPEEASQCIPGEPAANGDISTIGPLGFWGIALRGPSKISPAGLEPYGGGCHRAGSVYGVVFNADAGTVEFYFNGTPQGVAHIELTGRRLCPAMYVGSQPGCAYVVNLDAVYPPVSLGPPPKRRSRPRRGRSPTPECCKMPEGSGPPDLKMRALEAWTRHQNFMASPGPRCGDCWLEKKHCCCSGIPAVSLAARVILLMHPTELNQRRGSNTAKVLLNWGAELLIWGLEEHDEVLRSVIEEHMEDVLILFPSPDAVEAASAPFPQQGRQRILVVVDGGWRECKKMNESLGPRIARCRVTTARRSEFGGTRKYDHGAEDHVQTAAAFVALMRELHEDEKVVSSMTEGLAWYLNCYEQQINRTKT